MQSKGIIRLVAIALAIACLYSLSFTWVSRSVEDDAKAFAKGDLLRERSYLDSMATQPVYNLGFTEFSYQYCKEREIPLGLDLKGGMNVTMEISLSDLILSLSNHNQDPYFNRALAEAERLSATSPKDFISLLGASFDKLNPNGRLAPLFATKENKNNIKFTSTNGEVLDFLRKESKSAVERSFNILRTRIDKFGVTSPNIQLQEGSNRILIELPGVSDPSRVRKLLQGSAKLEFWETYDNREIFSVLDNLDKALAAQAQSSEKKTAINTTNTNNSSKLTALGKQINNTQDTSRVSPELAKKNPLFSTLAPSVYQTESGQQALRPGPMVGYASQKDTAKINEMLSSYFAKAIIPSTAKFSWSVKPIGDSKVFELYALKVSTPDGSPALAGDVVADAREDFDQKGNPEVIMVMNNDGARDWRRITAAAAADPQNKKSIAIVLDNAVYSAPTVQNEISGGVSSISGQFTINDTKDLANILKAGRLPAPAKIVEEAIVGPSLGEAAINAGLTSSVVGLLVVLIFMIFYYNRAGTVANIAVFVNVFFLMGVLASLGAVLTLPGIAGIVLTLGMAVDANVLIYERVREELAHGKNTRLAITDGFKHALPSILDSNVTTFLTGVILYIFGSGPIQGFATTLMIGILTSLFSAIFITRLIFEWMLQKNWDIKFSNPFSAHTFKNANFAFVKNRKFFYLGSGTFILAGIISIIIRGFSFGVDFKGGRSYVIKFEKAVQTEQVRSALEQSFGMSAEVKTFGNANQVRVTTAYKIEENSEAAEKLVETKLLSGLSSIKNNKSEILSTQKVGPTIANDIKLSAIYSVVFAIIIIAAYIFIRFKKWQYSLGALIALIHDVLLVLSFFSLFNGILPFSLDIDQAFIAAILTVVGYSINDTVVVFDRVREYLNLHHSKSDNMKQVINDAINSTLSRTIITALTVIFVLLVLFVFGGDIIRGFSFALLIGVTFGTYSSICVATPVVVEFQKKEKLEN